MVNSSEPTEISDKTGGCNLGIGYCRVLVPYVRHEVVQGDGVNVENMDDATARALDGNQLLDDDHAGALVENVDRISR